MYLDMIHALVVDERKKKTLVVCFCTMGVWHPLVSDVLQPRENLPVPGATGLREVIGDISTRLRLPRAPMLQRPPQHLEVPARVAISQVPSPHGQSCSRAHCNTARCPPEAAPVHVLRSQGQWCSRAHTKTNRCPFPAAPLGPGTCSCCSGRRSTIARGAG